MQVLKQAIIDWHLVADSMYSLGEYTSHMRPLYNQMRMSEITSSQS